MSDKCMTKVVNKNKSRYDVYIGRGSIFGNPFTIAEFGDRTLVIYLYKTYFDYKMNHHPEFAREVEKLKGKRLACYCKPKDCHGDIIVAYLESGKL
jgi:hypothetical protein